MTKYYVDGAGIYLGGFDGEGVIVPDGAIEVTQPPHGLATWDGSAWLMPPPSREEVNAERDRRTADTFTFNGVVYDLDPDSLQRITGAATLAGFAVGAGSPVSNLRWANADVDFRWIAKDNSFVPMDAQTAFAFGQAAANHVSAHIFAASSIKAMDPIPSDYQDDKWWP